jgi:hypothetical protein
MKISRRTKSLLLAASMSFVANSAWASPDNLLVNGDFKEGKAHWDGDGKDASSTDDTDINVSLENSGGAKGMLINLQSHWTSVSQTFDTGQTKLTLSMTYTTSPDYALEAFIANQFAPGLGGFLGFKLRGPPLVADPDSAVVVIADLAQNEVFYAPISAKAAPNGPVTSSVTIDGLMANEEKSIYILMPNGKGTITFTNITLTAPDAPAATSNNPFQN